MDTNQSYSHGLLYSVAPQDMTEFHLKEEAGKDDFDWEAYEAEQRGNSLTRIVFNFLKTTAVNWGVIKLH